MIKKIEYINWSTDIFQGFYESGLYNCDTLYNLQDEEGGYDFIEGGYDQFTEKVASQCTDLLNDYMRGGLIKNIKFKRLSSPAYYNFSTDKLVLEVECEWDKLVKYCEETKDDFNQYLQDNFTSYDGFTSFVPNNYTDFMRDLEDDFERLSQVVIEYYILNRIDDLEEYKLNCDEIAFDTLWEFIEPVKQEENN